MLWYHSFITFPPGIAASTAEGFCDVNCGFVRFFRIVFAVGFRRRDGRTLLVVPVIDLAGRSRGADKLLRHPPPSAVRVATADGARVSYPPYKSERIVVPRKMKD
jgi:hypothetical protein